MKQMPSASTFEPLAPPEANAEKRVVSGGESGAVTRERLDACRDEDQIWRDTRCAEIQARLDRANALIALGMRLGTFALPAFGFSLVAGVMCGPLSFALFAVPALILLLLLPVASVMLGVGHARRSLLLRYAQRNAIEVADMGDET